MGSNNLFITMGFIIMTSVSLTVLSSIINLDLPANAQQQDAKATSESKIIRAISTESGYDMIKTNAGPGIAVIDVRTPEEFSEGHLENAENINFLSPDFKEQVSKLDKSKTYFVYCRTGNRSSKAIDVMDQAGFQTVYNIGGIIDWESKGYPIVK